jgi:NADP-reducing hydrogenase subunit HndC
VGAIKGERKKVHFIDQDVCITCGICFDTCRFDAIEVR